MIINFEFYYLNMASAGRIAALSERIMNIQHTLKNETHTKRESLQRALRAVEEKFQNGSDNAHKKFALLKEQVSIDKKQLSPLLLHRINRHPW